MHTRSNNVTPLQFRNLNSRSDGLHVETILADQPGGRDGARSINCRTVDVGVDPALLNELIAPPPNPDPA